MGDKIRLIVEIPKEYYDDMKASNCWWSGLKKCVMNGIPLDEMTNGEVLKSLFPTAELILGNSDHMPDVLCVKEEWWNSPYKEGA